MHEEGSQLKIVGETWGTIFAVNPFSTILCHSNCKHFFSFLLLPPLPQIFIVAEVTSHAFSRVIRSRCRKRAGRANVYLMTAIRQSIDPYSCCDVMKNFPGLLIKNRHISATLSCQVLRSIDYWQFVTKVESIASAHITGSYNTWVVLPFNRPNDGLWSNFFQ